MNKVRISRCINRLGGGDDELYCSRVYRLSKIDPYGWVETRWVLDFTFYLMRGHKNHVKAAYLWEQRQKRKGRR